MPFDFTNRQPSMPEILETRLRTAACCAPIQLPPIQTPDAVRAIIAILRPSLCLAPPTLTRSSRAGHWTNGLRPGRVISTQQLGTGCFQVLQLSPRPGFHRLHQKPGFLRNWTTLGNTRHHLISAASASGSFAHPNRAPPISGPGPSPPCRPLRRAIPGPQQGQLPLQPTPQLWPSRRARLPARSPAGPWTAPEKLGLALPAWFHKLGQDGNGRHKHADPWRRCTTVLVPLPNR
jgi:hypothetical protein